jgi:hypothetical protein
MLIKNLFERDIFRPINGVVKADQLDDASIWQELEEFVVTREMDEHIRRFFSSYLDAIDHKNDADIAGKIGIWVSGFFGSGKSHFIKVLSYLLGNQQVSNGGQTKRAVEFFESKIKDPMLLGDIKRAVSSNTDVILFNIDNKASHKTGRDAILQVFLKVLNEMLGYSPDHPHIAHMERYLDEKGKLQKYRDAYRTATGSDWNDERDAYEFNRDEVIQAFSEATGQSPESSSKWIDNAESNFSLTVENFCKWVKEFLDTKSAGHRLIFLVDEVGQFVGTDSHLMLNLQTITEELGVTCKGRAWIVVTSQEDIDAVLGEMKPPKSNDFSKITGRFKTRLSLSSANVDEVIQERLLAKRPDVRGELEALFARKGDIVKNQLTFTNIGMTLRPYRDTDDFVRNYPFAPYQFQLMQKVFEAIRKAGATGLHLSRGERSILDAFQSAGKAVGLEEVGVLVPLYRFYPSIESFLDTAVKRTIDQAKDRNVEEFDIEILKVLFLILYVKEIRGNVDNLVTLCVDRIDVDRLALRRRVEESLQRLEKETLVSRSGDNYFFLTNEERDINREIKNVELTGSEDAKLLGEIIFEDVLRGQRKHRYSANKMDFDFNRMCDQHPVGNQLQGSLRISVITSLSDDYDTYRTEKCTLESGLEGGCVLIHLREDDAMERELRTFKQTEKYISQKSDGTQPEQTKRILRNIAEDNRERRTSLTKRLSEMLTEADYFVAGQSMSIKAAGPSTALDEALEYLVKNTFTKMSLLKRLQPDDTSRLREIQSTLRINDVGQLQLGLKGEDTNIQAIQDVRSYVELCTKTNRQIVLYDMIQSRYAKRPYGWPELETVLIVAQLMVMGEISLAMDGATLPLDRAYDSLTSPPKQRKITVVQRKTSDPKAVQDARNLGQKVFGEMGPDGEDALFVFLQNRLKGLQEDLVRYKALADTGDYPGASEIGDALTLIKPLLTDQDSFKFIERFNTLKKELLDLSDDFRDLDHFYKQQRTTWEKLRKALARFQLNRLQLDRDEKAAAAFTRMHEILQAAAPYGLIKEADGLIQAVETVNEALVAQRRSEATVQIDKHITALKQELDAVGADAALRSACLGPLEMLKQRVASQESIAHMTQAEAEAIGAFDSALSMIQEWSAKQQAAKQTGKATTPRSAVKELKVVKPADLAGLGYLETEADIEAFIAKLRQALKAAVAENKRIQIR